MSLRNPFRLRPDEERFREALETALVDDLYERSALAVPILLVVLLLLRQVLGTVYDENPLIRKFFWGMVAFALVRLVLLAWIWKGEGKPWATPRMRHIVFSAGAFLVGLGLGFITVLAYPGLSPTQICIVGVLQTGIMSGALLSMSSSPEAFLLYMFPNLGAYAILLALDTGAWQAPLLFMLVVLYIVIQTLFAFHQFHSRKNRILLALHLEEMAIRDSLTGLLNRRYLKEFMETEEEQVHRSWRSGTSDKRTLCLMMLDLDFFKRVNDSFGHGGGDAMLRQVAQVLIGSARKADVVIRWGGEEFLILAHIQGRDEPALIAERILNQVREHPFQLPDGQIMRLTTSIGFCIFPFSPDDPTQLGWEEVFTLADSALYHAKELGRDRVIGILPGDRAWDSVPECLGKVQQDLEEAQAQSLIRRIELA